MRHTLPAGITPELAAMLDLIDADQYLDLCGVPRRPWGPHGYGVRKRCPECEGTWARQYDLDRHLIAVHGHA
jgi:hypothetical protein